MFGTTLWWLFTVCIYMTSSHILPQMHVNAISTIYHWDQFTHIIHEQSSVLLHKCNYFKRTTFSAFLCRHNWQCITQASWHTHGRHTATLKKPQVYTALLHQYSINDRRMQTSWHTQGRHTQVHRACYTNTVLTTEECRHHDIPRQKFICECGSTTKAEQEQE